jgi:DNA-binding protein
VVSEGQICTNYSGLESEHNYANNTNKIWKYTYAGAKTLDITFDSQTKVDDGFDFIYIYDNANKEIKKATGTELAGKTVSITGDTVKIKLVSDEAITAWGFKVTKLSVDGSNEETSEPDETEKSDEKESSTEESSDERPTDEESSDEKQSSDDESDVNIKDGLYISGLKSMTYTGNAIKQNLKLYYNKNLLTESVDYTLSYKNNINVGTASVTIKAKGNLTGTVTKHFEIKAREITDSDVIIDDTVYTYDKKVHKKAPTVTFNGKALKEGKDYEVTDFGSGDYTSTGTYTVTLKGIGNFSGNYDNAKVIIADKGKDISKATVAKIAQQQYQNGKSVELPDDLIKVTLNKTELKNGNDYTVSYSNNINPSKATLIIKGKGDYVGTKKVNFVIKQTPIKLDKSMVTNLVAISEVEAVKGGATPQPVLKANGVTLVKGTDYTIAYKNNKKVGNASIVIKGKGNYSGSVTIPFTITTKDITSSDLDIRVPDVPYTGKANKYQSKPVITDIDGNKLALNKDYKVENYSIQGSVLDKKSIPENGSEITVTIQGKGNYRGTIALKYEIRGINFASAAIKVNSKSYTGMAVTIDEKDIISATIKNGKTATELTYGKDYDIAGYTNNVKKGTATVIFRGKGDYAGEKAVKFKINTNVITE